MFLSLAIDDTSEWELEQKEQSEFKFVSVEENYIVERVQLRDFGEEQFITFETRNEDDNGSGEVTDMTTSSDTQPNLYLPLWGWAAAAVAGLVLLACCICCPLILCLRKRRTKRGSFKLEQCEF